MAILSRRTVFEIVAWLLGGFLVAVALVVLVKLALVLSETLVKSADSCLKDWTGASADLITILGVAMAGVWFLIRLAYQREYDSAVDFDVAIESLHGTFQNKIALTAKLRNVTAIGAGIDAIEWKINTATDNTEVVRGAWNLPDGSPPILTRNSKWQLAQLATLPSAGMYKLIAICRIGMQPADQALHYEKVFMFPPD